MAFDQDAFDKFILDNDVIGFFDDPVTLKSGRQSHWYVNWRKVSNDVFLMDELSDHVISFVQDEKLKFDSFYGVPEGATKLGVLCQYKWAKQSPKYGRGSHILPMGRGKPKEHGKVEDRNFVGAPYGDIVVLEDVTTTGSSLIDTLDRIPLDERWIIATVGLTNRMEIRDDGRSVEGALKEDYVDYFHMSNAIDLLPLAYERLRPGEDIADAVEAEFERCGVQPLKLK